MAEEQNTEPTPASTSEQLEQMKQYGEDIEKLSKEVQTLKTRNEELLDKYRRSLADSENLRTRLTKQISEAKIYGIQNFCKDLLEVADTLTHATESVPTEQVCIFCHYLICLMFSLFNNSLL